MSQWSSVPGPLYQAAGPVEAPAGGERPMTRDTFTIGLIQMRMSADREVNLAKAEAAIADAAKRGAEVVCLPELFTGYYFCQKEDPALFDLAEPIPGPSTERLGAAARANNVVVVGSLFEKRRA